MINHLYQNNLVKEIAKIAERRTEAGESLPMPTYLYVEHFGRNIEEHMEELAGLLGEKEYFVFKLSRLQKKESLLRNLLMELEKHAALGKEFSGCVLVDLSEMESHEELGDFLEYVSEQDKVKWLFTIRGAEEAMVNLLEQFFFVRVVKGEAYGCEEQQEILNKVFVQYGFSVEEAAETIFKNFFAEKEWEDGDMVSHRIENIAKNLVYEKLMEGTTAGNITEADATAAIERLGKDSGKRNVIGFCLQ